MMVIREYVNEMEAVVARSVLEAHHIPAVVLRDDAGGMLPSMHLLYPVRLAVRVGDATHALRILDAPFEGDALVDEVDGQALVEEGHLLEAGPDRLVVVVDGLEDLVQFVEALWRLCVTFLSFPFRLADHFTDFLPDRRLNNEIGVCIGILLPTQTFEDPARLTSAGIIACTWCCITK